MLPCMLAWLQGWQWMNRASPTSWVLYGLAGSQLGDRDVPMQGYGGATTTVSAFMETAFGACPAPLPACLALWLLHVQVPSVVAVPYCCLSSSAASLPCRCLQATSLA